MTAPTWQEAITPTTQAEYVDLNLAALSAAGSKLNGWSDDSPQRALVEGESAAEAAESQIVAQIAKTASPATVIAAGDSWVDATMSWFDIARTPAIAAVWSIPCAVTTTIAPFVVDSTNAGTIQAMATNGEIFLCTTASPVLFNAASSYQGTLRFAARIPGASAVTPGSITRLISGPAGLSITGSGQTLVTAGADAESSAALITRGLGRWGVILGDPTGTAGWVRQSFDYLIPSFVPTITRWNVDDANPLGPGTVLVTVANATGPATGTEVTNLQEGLTGKYVQPVGAGQLTVQAATTHALTITATLQTDGSNPDTAANVASALVALDKALPIGPYILAIDLLNSILMGSAIATATIELASGLFKTITLDLPGFAGVSSVVTSSPSVDTTFASGEVLVLTVGAITVLT